MTGCCLIVETIDEKLINGREKRWSSRWWRSLSEELTKMKDNSRRISSFQYWRKWKKLEEHFKPEGITKTIQYGKSFRFFPISKNYWSKLWCGRIRRTETTPNVYIPVDLHRFKLSQEFPMNYLILESPFRLERLSLSISCGINSSLSRLASNGERQIEFFDPCEETEAVV